MDIGSSLHLDLLMGVSAMGVGSETLEIHPQSSHYISGLVHWNTQASYNREGDGWTLDISEDWDKRSMDAAIRTIISPNALYHPGGSTQWWPSLSWSLSYRMDLSMLLDCVSTSFSM